MKGVKFGNYHSYINFSLILKKGGLTLETPKAKTEYVEIPGADGKLDLTDYFGDVKYSNRKLSASFETMLRHQEFFDLIETIANAIHGKRLNIILDEETNFYLVGRVNVNQYKSIEQIGAIVIDADCEPYKLEINETIVSHTLNSVEKEVYLTNLRKRVSPSIEVVANEGENVYLTFEGTTYSLSNGSWTIPEMILKEGQNYIKLSGNGTITFKYRRGKL